MLKLQALDTLTAASSELHSATTKTSASALAASSPHEAGLAAVAGLTLEAGLAAEQPEASALLKGRVPWLQDWVDAWAAASLATSYLKEARIR